MAYDGSDGHRHGKRQEGVEPRTADSMGDAKFIVKAGLPVSSRTSTEWRSLAERYRFLPARANLRPSNNPPTPLGNPRQRSTKNVRGTGAETSSDAATLPLPPLSENDKDSVCVAITGGAGQIAYSLLPLILHGRVFGEGRKLRLRLLDIDSCADALEGVAMEIRDCRSPLVTEVVTTTDPETAFDGADVAILLGGFPRLPGMERRDLIAKNVPIMAEHGRAIARRAKAGVRVLVVANPACTNCLVASTCAPSVPRHHFSSLARLDQERLAAMVAERMSTSVQGGDQEARQARLPSSVDIRGVFLWGNHSPSMWPDVSRVEIKMCGAWVSVERLLRGSSSDSAAGAAAAADAAVPEKWAGLAAKEAWDYWVASELVKAVRERGTRVMEARGKSSALSAAEAIARHLRDWLSFPAESMDERDEVAERGAIINGIGQKDRDEGSDSSEGSRRSDGSVHEGLTRPVGEGSHRSGASASTWEGRWCVLREGYRCDKDERVQVAAAGVSMGVYSDGNPYGVPDGLFYSFPVLCGEGRHRILEGFAPDKAMLEASTQELLEERRQAFEVLEELGLLP